MSKLFSVKYRIKTDGHPGYAVQAARLGILWFTCRNKLTRHGRWVQKSHAENWIRDRIDERTLGAHRKAEKALLDSVKPKYERYEP